MNLALSSVYKYYGFPFLFWPIEQVPVMFNTLIRNKSQLLFCACSDCKGDSFCQASSACFKAVGLGHCSNDLECYGCFDKQMASYKVN